MQANFIQPSGTTSVQSSAEMFSQLLNIPLSAVTTLDKNVDLTNFSFGIDPASKEIFNISAVTGTVASISIIGTTANIATDKGSFQVVSFPATLTTFSVATIDDLRKFEPWFEGQRVVLEKAVNNGCNIYANVTYDANDSASIDDGYRTIVTQKNKRWIIDNTKGIHVGLGGFLKDGSNLGTAIQNIIDKEVAKIIAVKNTFGSITQIVIPNMGFQMKLDKPIIVPSFFTLKTAGTVQIKYTGPVDKDAITIANTQLTGIADGGMQSSNYADMQGSNIFDASGGSFMITGAGSSVSTAAGIAVGSFGDPKLSVRDLTMKNFRLFGFYYGITFNYKNNYINTLEDFNIGTCQIGVYFPYPTASAGNSGEKIIFKNACFGGFSQAIFKISNYNVQCNIVDCSLDYCAKDIFYFDQYSNGSVIDIQRGWIEGWGGMLVNAPFETRTGPGASWFAKGCINFNGVYIVPNQYNNPKYDASNRFMHVRQMCSIPNNGVGVAFNGCHWHISDKLMSKYWCLSGMGNTGGIDSDNTGGKGNVISLNGRYSNQDGPISFTNGGKGATETILGDYLCGLMGWRYNFNFTAGNLSTGATCNSSRYKLGITSTAGTATVRRDETVDTDGFRAMILNATSTTDIFSFTQIYLFSGTEGALGWFYSAISAMRSTGFSGDIKVRTSIRLLDTETVTATLGADNVITVTKNRALMDASSNVNGDWFSVGDQFIYNDTLYGTTYDDYLAIPTAVRQSALCDKIEVSIQVTGFTGSVRVKLPVLWRSNNNNNT